MADDLRDPLGASLVRIFDTGATRGSLDGKLRYTGSLSPRVLKGFAEYMERHTTRADGTKREIDDWKKGIPKASYVDSLVRHVVDFWAAFEAGDMKTAEELAYAIMFNTQGFLHERGRDKEW